MKIKVPDVPAPSVKLCWKRNPDPDLGGMGGHCTIMTGHECPHIWELTGRIKELEAVLRESRREHIGEVMHCAALGYGMRGNCTCGADAWNARVDTVLAAANSPVHSEGGDTP